MDNAMTEEKQLYVGTTGLTNEDEIRASCLRSSTNATKAEHRIRTISHRNVYIQEHVNVTTVTKQT